MTHSDAGRKGGLVTALKYTQQGEWGKKGGGRTYAQLAGIEAGQISERRNRAGSLPGDIRSLLRLYKAQKEG